MFKNKKYLTIILIIIILVVGYFLLFSKTANHDNLEIGNGLNYDNVNVTIRDMAEVPAEYFSGSSRYSHGECKQDHDCVKQGCNLEMCTSDKNLMTTCEIDGNAPDKNIYNCGCIKDTCGWFLKK